MIYAKVFKSPVGKGLIFAKNSCISLPFFKTRTFSQGRPSIFRLLFGGICLLGLSACTPGGLNLIRQLEARSLKSRILAERDMCYFDFVKLSDYQRCYEEASTRLIAEECITIRRTEPIYQRDCEDFLYRIVMKPDSMFPGHEAGEEFRSASRIGEGSDLNYLNPDVTNEVSRPGGCEEDTACKTKCRGFFGEAEDNKACYAYSVAAVNELEKVFNAFAAPTSSNLSGLNLRYVRVALNINADKTFSEKEDEWTAAHRDAFLKWMAEKTGTPSAAKVFRETDEFFDDDNDDYSLLKEMLNETTVGSSLSQRLGKSLTGATNGKDNNFIDRALVSRNEDILLWLHEFMEESGSDEVTIFADIYCSQHYTSNNDRKYLDYEFFLDFLDTIMETGRKAETPDDGDDTNEPPSWWTVNMRARDLKRSSTSRWYSAEDAVCWSREGGGVKPGS